MTKEEFKNVVDEFYAEMAITKVFAIVGPGEDDHYLIIQNSEELYQVRAKGIMIKQGRNYFYVPYETIIAMSATQ